MTGRRNTRQFLPEQSSGDSARERHEGRRRPCNYGGETTCAAMRAWLGEPRGSRMSEGTDKAALAIAHDFRVHDIEWQDRLIELLRDADMEGAFARCCW